MIEITRKVMPNTCDTLDCGPNRHAHSGCCDRHCGQTSVCWAERNTHDPVARKILDDYAGWLSELARS